MKLFYKETGSGHPLIILHGLLGSSDNWTTLARQMEGYRVFLVDQRNHGRSPHSDDFSYSAMAGDLKQFITEKGLEKPHIVGHSMGGKTAMNYAVSNWENIGKLVVVDMSPRYYEVDYTDILAGLTAINLQSLERREEAEDILAGYVSDTGTRMFLLKNLYRNEAGGFAWRMNLQVISEKIKDIGEAVPTDRPFDGPVLFIKGGDSKYITAKDGPLIKSIFPKAAVREIPGAGHWVHAEKPEEILEMILGFLNAPST